MTFLLAQAKKIPRRYFTIGCIAVGTALLTVWQTHDMRPVLMSKAEAKENHVSTCEHILFRDHDTKIPNADISVDDIFSGEPHQVLFSHTFSEAYTYRTRIRSDVQGGANFAGHYRVVSIGCGTNCAKHAVVDMKTGAIIAFGLPTAMGASFNVNSRLLILNPKEGFPSLNALALNERELLREWSVIPRSYYMLDETPNGAVFRLLCIEHPFDGKLSSTSL